MKNFALAILTFLITSPVLAQDQFTAEASYSGGAVHGTLSTTDGTEVGTFTLEEVDQPVAVGPVYAALTQEDNETVTVGIFSDDELLNSVQVFKWKKPENNISSAEFKRKSSIWANGQRAVK